MQLPPALRQPLNSVLAAWGLDTYDISQYTFYMGYHAALSLVLQVERKGVTGEMAQKIRQTEEELHIRAV